MEPASEANLRLASLASATRRSCSWPGEAEGAGEVHEQPGTVFFVLRLPGRQRIREVLAQGGGFVRGGKGIEEGQGMRVVEVGNDEAAEEGVQLGLGHPARQQRLHPGLGERSPDGLFNRLV